MLNISCNYQSFDSSIVPKPRLSLRVVLFDAQCDKPPVSTSTSEQCLFQSQMDNTVKGNTQELARLFRYLGLQSWIRQNTSRRKEPPFQKRFCGPANAWPVNEIYHGQFCLPIPKIQCMWDSATRKFLRPSPWSILQCTSVWKFGRTRADKVQWLSPTVGKQLACVCGQAMCHVECLMN